MGKFEALENNCSLKNNDSSPWWNISIVIEKKGENRSLIIMLYDFCFNILELVYGYCYDEYDTQIGLVWFKWE